MVSLDISCDVTTLLNKIGDAVGQTIKPDGITSTSPNGNDRFVSVMNDNQVVGAYFHPTKRHYAVAEGKTKSGRSYAPAGQWAYAVVMRALWGNKTFYGTD